MKLGLLFVLLLVCGVLSARPTKDYLASKDFRAAVNRIADAFNKPKVPRVTELSVTCGVCGILVNEIEGFVAENRTVQEIEDYLTSNLCNKLSGGLTYVCDLLVDQLPFLIEQFENTNSVSVICVNLKLCSAPFPNVTDPQPMPKYVINLDTPPIMRWTQICSNPQFKQIGQFLYNTVTKILPGGGAELESIGEDINNNYMSVEFAQEIQGCSKAMGVPYGWITLFNLGYEVTDACTSILAQTPDGKILHARNLDFWDGMGFTDSLKDMAVEIDWQRGGKTIFTTSSFAGFIGALSGIKRGAFSVTINTRFYPDGIGELFYEVIAAITEQGAQLVSLLTREVLTQDNDWQSALNDLSNTPLVADVYYTLAGVKSGEGAIISRNRTDAADVWILNAPSRWYEVITNYDHWTQPPWFDDRLDPANTVMDSIGQSAVTLDNMFTVLSTKPVFNLQTTYSILSCPATGEYRSYLRYCPYPCVE